LRILNWIMVASISFPIAPPSASTSLTILPLEKAADGGIAGHPADGVEALRQAEGCETETRKGQRSSMPRGRRRFTTAS
jgi:hypothetical protein